MPAKLISEVPLSDWPAGRQPGWVHTPDGYESPHGRVEHRVVLGPDGKPRFDRPVIFEAPHVIMLAWGLDGLGRRKLGLVKESRDTAALLDGESTCSFWGPPRGFVRADETVKEAVHRETGEETGAKVIISSDPLQEWITNETTTSSWSPIFNVQVDLTQIGQIRQGRGEKIFKAEWFTQEDLRDMMRQSEYQDASTRSMVLMTVVSLFAWLNY